MTEYLERMASRLGSLPIDRDNHNAIFVKKGRYEVRIIPNDEATHEEMINRLTEFNRTHKVMRCLMIRSPDWMLRFCQDAVHPKGFIGPMQHSDAMKTFCAPMKDKPPQKLGFKAQGRLDDMYLIPDDRQVAAELVNDNNDLVEVAIKALEATNVTLNSKTPFENSPLYPKRRD